MACERVDISILVVDDDDTSLAMIAHILNSLEYEVLIAKGAHNALETLREFEGFFNLVITELNISGMMNGFEFQKRVQNEFQLPVIMMSADSRKSVVSKCLENGAAHFIFKPICKDDFKDIWQYALVARKGRQTTENIERPNDNKIIVHNVNSYAASSLIEPKRKRKYGQRKSPQMSMEDQSDGSTRLVKKQKVVWTTYLHNLFLLAIKQIGLEGAVPKKILQIMNVPNLTRENVASHLQKYRIFLRKIAEKGLLEGLSQRTLRSKFASGLSASMIRDIQRRTTKRRVPVQQYLKSSLAHQTENGGNIANVVTPFNHVPRSAYVTTPLERGHDQFTYPLHKGLNLMLQNQHGGSLNNVAILGGVESRYGSNVIGANNIQQKMEPYQAKSSYNVGSVFPTYGTMGHSLMNSTNGLTGGFKYCEPMYQNYGSLENHHNFGYGQGNWNMGSLNISRNNQPWTSSIYNPSTSIQLNGGSKMVGNGIKRGVNSTFGAMDSTTNKNGFGLINGTTQNANMNVATLGHGNFGLTQGGFGLTHGNSKAGDGWPSEVPKALINNGTQMEKGSGITQLPQQLGDNVAQKEHQHNATSICEGMVSHMEDDLSELFLVLDEMNLLNETEENLNASEFFKSGPSSSSQVVQSLEQSNRAGDVIVNPMKSTINLPNESLTSSDKSSDQLPSDDGFADMEPFDKFIVDDVSSAASNSAPNDQDWDMELIEALFGDEAYKRE